jgi:hypothetical protein
MARTPARKVLSENAKKLAPKHDDGKPNTTQFGMLTGLKVGGAQRILTGDASVGIDLVDRVAAHYHLDTWQILVPDFDPENPPHLGGPGGGRFDLSEREQDTIAAVRSVFDDDHDRDEFLRRVLTMVLDEMKRKQLHGRGDVVDINSKERGPEVRLRQTLPPRQQRKKEAE